MSRHLSPSDVEPPNLAEDYVHYVSSNAVPKAMTLEELKEQTKKDAEMRTLITAIETDQWNNQEVQGYKRLKDEFSVHNGLVLRRNRIVIPATLRNKADDLAHLGHQGIVKKQQLTHQRQSVVPRNRQDDRRDKKLSSMSHSDSKITTTRTSSYNQTSQCTLERSFVGPFPSGDYTMVVIDKFSRFPEVELLTSTSVKAVIPKLDAIFAREGVPDILKSDNGLPFNGHEFENFANHLGSRSTEE